MYLEMTVLWYGGMCSLNKLNWWGVLVQASGRADGDVAQYGGLSDGGGGLGDYHAGSEQARPADSATRPPGNTLVCQKN